MELKKIEDALTGSEYADVQGFTGLKVRFAVDQRILVPQMYDGPFRRTAGRGLPFNPLGIVAVPIAVLPEGLQGLVQVDDLMGEVSKLVSLERLELAKLEENADVAMDVLLAKAEETVGAFCVAGPGLEGIEVDNMTSERVRDLVMDMRYRNKPEDLIFLGREVEVELSGERSPSIKSAIDLKAKPMRSTGEKRAEMHRGYGGTHEQMMRQAMRSRCMPSVPVRVHDQIDFTHVDWAPVEARVMGWYTGDVDVRRQKFALTATKITLV